MKFTLVFVIFLIVGNAYAQYDIPKRLIQAELIRSGEDDENFELAKKYYFLGKWDSVVVYSNRFFELNKSKKSARDFCLFFRARSFVNLGLNKEGIKDYKNISKQFPFYNYTALQIGAMELEMKRFPNALNHLRYVEENAKNDPTISEGLLFNYLGICYLHLDSVNLAERYLLKSSTFLEKDTSNRAILFDLYTNLANLYYNQYKDAEAIPYFEKAYGLSNKIDNFSLKMISARNMAVVEENRNNLAKSIEYRKEYDQWKDSLNDQNKVWEIAQLEKKHISEQGKKREQVLQAENKAKVAQRNGFIYSSILLLVLLGTGLYFYIQKLRSNRVILAQKKELGILNATKDRLFSIVSHDLRSNVNGLRLSNSKLTKHLDEGNYAELRDLVRSNGSIANSTYSLLDNLLNWAMIQTEQLYFNIESVNCHAVVDQVSFNYLPLMEEKGISFENTIPKQLLVDADLDSLKIILRNFIDNAIKYSGENASISVSANDLSDNRCAICIADTGNGMSEKLVESLLKPSSSNEVLGNGLGLQLCKELIDKNKGSLTVESTLGKGTKMGINLQKSA